MNLKLYEIDAAIDAAIEAGTDPETGEITNLEEITALQMQREEKLENIALYIKNLSAIATALKNEIDVLNERRKRTEKNGGFVAIHIIMDFLSIKCNRSPATPPSPQAPLLSIWGCWGIRQA